MRLVIQRQLVPLQRFYSSNIKQTNKSNSETYCLNLVRNFDNENFLCTLLLDAKTRRNALAIRAFNIEVARVSSATTEDKIGQLRYKFWEDTVERLYKNDNKVVPDHPVIQELNSAIGNSKLSKRYFQRLITARSSNNMNFITTKQLEDYAEQSVSSVYYLILETMKINNVNVDHALSHLGKAQGIANLLRGIHKQNSRKVPIPQQILMENGVSQERILRNKPEDKGVEDSIFKTATIAHQHLEKARALYDKVPKEVKPIFLPGVAISRYLENLRKVNFNLAHKDLAKKDSLLPIAYYWNNFRGTF